MQMKKESAHFCTVFLVIVTFFFIIKGWLHIDEFFTRMETVYERVKKNTTSMIQIPL